MVLTPSLQQQHTCRTATWPRPTQNVAVQSNQNTRRLTSPWSKGPCRLDPPRDQQANRLAGEGLQPSRARRVKKRTGVSPTHSSGHLPQLESTIYHKPSGPGCERKSGTTLRRQEGRRPCSLPSWNPTDVCEEMLRSKIRTRTLISTMWKMGRSWQGRWVNSYNLERPGNFFQNVRNFFLKKTEIEITFKRINRVRCGK